ncbi:serine protease [Methylocystis sp.]|uniref:S1 family peptidase n=1 Tax=Methylocystis sp. TaxID=1911079 RepID=UPI00260151DB|nr:serine protease [Methylocystis sp.]
MPGCSDSPEDIVARADRLRETLGAQPTKEAVAEAASLLGPLRDLREFERLCVVADLVCGLDEENAEARRLYAQGLIETRRFAAAIGVLEEAKIRYGESHREYAELEGLLGRVYKQLLMDIVDPNNIWASEYLRRAVESYNGPYTRDRGNNFWHGINLGALTHAAARRGLKSPSGRSARDYVDELIVTLNAIGPAHRNEWWSATLGEAYAARTEWKKSEDALRAYLGNTNTTPFMLASTLRQLRQLWAIQDTKEGAELLQMLEAALMRRPTPGAVLRMDASHLREMRNLEAKDSQRLQRLVGPRGLETLEWYKMGLGRAASVAAITEKLGLRFGTGFMVEAGDFGVEPADEKLLLTNFHVLNKNGLGGRRSLSNVKVVFEAIADVPLSFAVDEVLVESPADGGLDYSLIRLNGSTEPLKTLEICADAEMSLSPEPRVYVIGYPLGDVMQFSLQDNVLKDHELPPTGKPPDPTRLRLHYTASTEKGSSGSPVFNDKWECIGLHHAGGKSLPQDEVSGIPGLNGSSVMRDFNEGIWIGSIQADVKPKNIKLS